MSIASSGKPKTVLVTGATGFLGLRLVKSLVARGYRVRALARKTSRIERLQMLNIETCYGDVADLVSLEPAFADIDVVVHTAAGTKGNKTESLRTTINGTQNIVSLSRKHKIDKLIYISSCSVYGVSELRKDQSVDESATLERQPEKRGFYSEAKLKAEQLLTGTTKEEKIPFVCLRPGTIFGEGGDIFTPMIGFSAGTKLFAIIDNGAFILPLVYIENLVEAIILAIESKRSTGQIYNVVDLDHVTKREYVETLFRELYPDAKIFYLPYPALYATVFLQEIIFKLLQRKPLLTTYRLTSSQRNIVYDSSKIQKELGWKPSITLKAAIKKVLDYEIAKQKGTS